MCMNVENHFQLQLLETSYCQLGVRNTCFKDGILIERGPLKLKNGRIHQYFRMCINLEVYHCPLQLLETS